MSVIQKAVIKGQLAGSVNWRNIFYAQVAHTSLDTYQLLWAAYLDSVYDPILPEFSTAWSIQSFEVYEWQSPDWILMDEVVYAKAGTATYSILPNLVAVVLIGKILGNRAFGRKFFSGITAYSLAPNSLTSESLGRFATALAGYLAVYLGENGGVLGPGIRTKDGSFHAFTSGLVSSFLGSMRRRKPGMGI